MISLISQILATGIALLATNPDHNSYTAIPDTIYLDEVKVQGARIYEPRSVQPLQIQRIDSTAIRMSGASSLGELLERQSGVFMSNYGPAGANSATQRGMPSRHTQVMWNGINMNSETLGSCDVSTIPAAMITDIELSSSGSASYGSGAVGGQVQLNSSPNTGFRASQSLGTIGQQITSAEAGTKTGGWTIFGRGVYENTDNDFEYEDPFSADVLTRENNHLEQLSLGGGIEGSVGNTRIESQVWWLDMERGVPGQTTSPTRSAYQEDRHLQWMADIRRPLTDQFEAGVTGYLKRQNLDYFNPSTDLESLTESREYRLRLPFEWNVSTGLDLQFAGETALMEVESNNFGDKDRRVQTGQISGNWQPVQALRIYPALRFDHYSDFGSAVSASLGGNYELLDDALYARAYASRDFSAPTFNDLYWPQSGNPDLEAEMAHRFETGLFYQLQGEVALRLDALIFVNQLEDGIEWRPIEGTWRPENVQYINAHGTELESTVMTYIQGITVDWTNRYSYTRSEYGEGHNYQGNQIRFMPQHQFNTRLNVSRDPVTLSTGWFGVGRRYSSPENSPDDSVDPYHEWDIAIAWDAEFYGVDVNLRWNIHNVLDHRYDVVPNYPVLGRRHQATLSVAI